MSRPSRATGQKADGPRAAPREPGRRRRTRSSRRTHRDGPTRRATRPSPPAAEAGLPPDSLRQAVWLGERVPHFKSLTAHPLFPAIHGRLVAGVSPYRIASWIQDKVPPNDPLGRDALQAASLARKLQRYRRHLPKSTFLPPSFVDELVQGAEIEVDVIHELAGLVVLQKQRLTSALQIERQMQLPLDQVRREVEALADLLRQLRDTQIALEYRGWTMMAASHPAAGVEPIPVPASSLDQFLTEHPERIADVLPVLRVLDEVGLDTEPARDG